MTTDQQPVENDGGRAPVFVGRLDHHVPQTFHGMHTPRQARMAG